MTDPLDGEEKVAVEMVQPVARGCQIREPSERAIRLEQMRPVLSHVKRRATNEGWVSIDEPSGEHRPVEWSKVCMYDVLAYVVKPATRPRRCALVELMASGPQKPHWFTSHWWGQPFVDTVACLEQHARDRSLHINKGCYWICAFAICQWDLAAHSAIDPFRSPFYAALKTAEGVVSIVDGPNKGCGTCALAFGRLWVDFEAAIALMWHEDEGYLYDIYTPCVHRLEGEDVHPPHGLKEASTFVIRHGGKAREKRFAVGLTDPFAPLELGLRGICAKQYESAKEQAYRQSYFPSEILVQALASDLETATVTVDADRARLLNAMALHYNMALEEKAQAKSSQVKSGSHGGGSGGGSKAAGHAAAGKKRRDSRSTRDTKEKDQSLSNMVYPLRHLPHRRPLSKAELEAEPPATHPAYGRFSGAIRSRFATQVSQQVS